MKPVYQYNAKVVRWIDGDSVVLDIDCGFSVFLGKQNVRLYGIDTSETRGGTPELKWLGNLAKQHVNDVCPAGSEIIIKTHLDKKGKFGRILAEIYMGAGMISLNDELKQKRLAVDYHGQSKKEILELHNLNVAWHKERGEIF